MTFIPYTLLLQAMENYTGVYVCVYVCVYIYMYVY